ncbi:MAG: hypothetical protein K940chlam2_00631 [Chlamydiae bacterium]|nr:hypothetical protein [Chlamydiota bacterium]
MGIAVPPSAIFTPEEGRDYLLNDRTISKLSLYQLLVELNKFPESNFYQRLTRLPEGISEEAVFAVRSFYAQAFSIHEASSTQEQAELAPEPTQTSQGFLGILLEGL